MQVDPTELDRLAQRLERLAADISSSNRRVQAAVDSSTWTSPRADRFRASMSQRPVVLRLSSDLLLTIAHDLRAQSAALRAGLPAVGRASASFGGVPTGQLGVNWFDVPHAFGAAAAPSGLSALLATVDAISANPGLLGGLPLGAAGAAPSGFAGWPTAEQLAAVTGPFSLGSFGSIGGLGGLGNGNVYSMLPELQGIVGGAKALAEPFLSAAPTDFLGRMGINLNLAGIDAALGGVGTEGIEAQLRNSPAWSPGANFNSFLEGDAARRSTFNSTMPRFNPAQGIIDTNLGTFGGPLGAINGV